ncbi:MAG: hypothetical protein U0175_33930 [Caldilineaceae bacterium]
MQTNNDIDEGHTFRPTRRGFLRMATFGSLSIGGLGTVFGVGRVGEAMWEQHVTWQEVTCDAATFVKKYSKKLARLHFGASLCPDYELMAAGANPDRTVKLLKDNFGCTHVRLCMRWSTHAEQGMGAYDPWLAALLKYGIKTIVAYGAKAPFPPETHFPTEIEQNLASYGIEKGSTIYADSPLGKLTLDYSQRLLDHLETEFGLDSLYGFNPENEFDAHFGLHLLASSDDLLRAQAQLLYDPGHPRRILINSAIISPPWQEASLSHVVKTALSLRQEFPTLEPIIGTDIYEETGAGRLAADFYVDTFAGVRLRHGDSLIPSAKRTLATAGIPLEVTEFQISDWNDEPRQYQPGSRIHTQYLLARMMDYLVDETPATSPFIVRLWEMSIPLRNMLADERYFATNDTFKLIQRLNEQNRGLLK